MNNRISARYTIHDPSPFQLSELMSAIFVIFVQIMMLLKRFKFRYWRQPIRMQKDQHETFVLKMQCAYRFHLLSIIRNEDSQQSTTGQNRNHVTNSKVTSPISANLLGCKKRN